MTPPPEIDDELTTAGGSTSASVVDRVVTALLAALAASTAIHARATTLVMVPLTAVVLIGIARQRRWRDVPRGALVLVPWLLWQSATRAATTSIAEGLRLRTAWYWMPYPVVGSVRLDPGAVRFVLRALFASHTLLIGLALVQRAVDLTGVSTLLLREDPVRLAGWTGHPNTYAGVLALVLLVDLCVGVLDDRRWLLWSPVLTVGLVLTGSRSYLAAVAICVVVLVLLTPERRLVTRLAFVLLAVAVVAGALVPDLAERVGQSGDLDRNSFRLHSWEVSWDTFIAHPVTGVGGGLLADELEPFVESGYVDNAAQGHSLYLHELAETGLVGAILLLAIYGWFLRELTRRYDRSSDPLVAALQLAAALSIVALLIGGVFDHSASNALVSVVLTLVLGLAEGHHLWWSRQGARPLLPATVDVDASTREEQR